MDPTEALLNIIDLIDAGELKEAAELSRDLEQWLIAGGFYPRLDADLQRQLIFRFLINISGAVK